MSNPNLIFPDNDECTSSDVKTKKTDVFESQVIKKKPTKKQEKHANMEL